MIVTGENMRKLQIILCLLLAILAACGPKKVAVRYADTFIEQQVEKRLPLYSSQEEALSKDIDKFLNEHKDRARAILPMLDRIDLDRAASLDEEYPKITNAYLEIARDFSAILAKHMSKFDEKQTKDFLKKMLEENSEIFQRDRKERRKKIETRVRSFLGTLTDEQIKILKDHEKLFDEQVVIRSERRSRLHTEFKNILEQEMSATGKEKMIFDAFVAYQKESLSNTKNLEIARKFIPTLSRIQKTNLKGKIMEIQEILNYFIETVY